MSGQDLYNQLNSLTSQLDMSLKQLRSNGRDYAEAEKNYKMELTKQALLLREQQMAITLIDKTVYGYPNVAELRFKRDVAESIYKANQEAINVLKLKIRLLDNQISKEYGEG